MRVQNYGFSETIYYGSIYYGMIYDVTICDFYNTILTHFILFEFITSGQHQTFEIINVIGYNGKVYDGTIYAIDYI